MSSSVELNSEITRDSTVPDDVRSAYLQLQAVVKQYLNAHPHLTVAGLSLRCGVSEPTLRRIHSGQVKTLPTVTTVIGLLMYVSKKSTIEEVLEAYPGPLASYLKSKMPQLRVTKKIVYSESLSRSLRDPVKYLIYKMAASSSGVEVDKVLELFGQFGEKQLAKLLAEELVEVREGRVVSRLNESFALSHELFVEHFKATADFIKPQKQAMAEPKYSPLFSNFSNGVNKRAYAEILKIQRAANQKIIRILQDPASYGEIPVFVLNAVDTLDARCADEFPNCV